MCTEMQNTTPSSHPKALFTSRDAIAVAHCCFSKRKTQGRFYFNFGLIQVRIKIREQIQCKNGKSKEDNVLFPTCSQQKQLPLSVPLKPSPPPPSPPVTNSVSISSGWYPGGDVVHGREHRSCVKTQLPLRFHTHLSFPS